MGLQEKDYGNPASGRASRRTVELENDETDLMQCLYRRPEFATYHAGDRLWVARMLQREMEMLQERQKGIGAKVRQLNNRLQDLEQPGLEATRDLLESVIA